MDAVVTITEISYAQLLLDIDTRIQQAFANHKIVAASASEHKEELLSTRQAARLLSVSKVTIGSWRTRGLIRSHKIGRHILYKRSELLEDLQSIPAGREGANHV